MSLDNVDVEALVGDVMLIVNGELQRYSFLNCKTADVRGGIRGQMKQNIKTKLLKLLESTCKPILEPGKLLMERNNNSPKMNVHADVELEKANYRIKILLRTICELENGKSSARFDKVNIVDDMSCTKLCTKIPLQPLPKSELIKRIQYLDGTLDFFLYRDVNLGPFRLIHPHEWHDFDIKDDLRIACQRGLQNGRCVMCKTLFGYKGIMCTYSSKHNITRMFGWPGFHWLAKLSDSECIDDYAPETSEATKAHETSESREIREAHEAYAIQRAITWRKYIKKMLGLDNNDKFKAFIQTLGYKSSDFLPDHPVQKVVDEPKRDLISVIDILENSVKLTKMI